MIASTPLRLTLAGAMAAGLAAPGAAEGVVNLYSSRHYDTDEQLYTDFTDQTGIEVNLIEASADELLARIQNEGANSPADVLITVDAGRLWRAVEAGVLSPVESETLEMRIPDFLQHPDNLWFSFSQRARVIFYDKEQVDRPPMTYEELADPRFEGEICIRSSSNIYNQSLLASVISHHGAEAAKEWAGGVMANMARDPQGGDTDQLRGVVSGECSIAVANTYYFARALRKDVSGLTGSTDRLGWVFPNQGDRGTHVNVSGAGVVATAPNRDNAVRFLEYLASDSAQAYFSAGNDEYPVVAGAALSPSVAQLGFFRQDTLNLDELGVHQAEAVRIFDEIGWK